MGNEKKGFTDKKYNFIEQRKIYLDAQPSDELEQNSDNSNPNAKEEKLINLKNSLQNKFKIYFETKDSYETVLPEMLITREKMMEELKNLTEKVDAKKLQVNKLENALNKSRSELERTNDSSLKTKLKSQIEDLEDNLLHSRHELDDM